MAYTKKPKFSYSKLNTYESCGWKYNLTYVKGHYIFTDSLASELGTLLHWVEEHIAKSLKDGVSIDYDQLKDDFQNLNIPKTSAFDTNGGVYGLNILKEKYKAEFYQPDENGISYYTKTLDYMSYGIYRLERYMKENPSLRIWDMEKYFSVNYKDNVFSGYIDRILYNVDTNEYIIEDIKTKGKPFKDTELTTPMQFVIYTYALANILGVSYNTISCCYDLPFCDLRQPAGTKGYMTRGLKKLDSDFAGIDGQDFTPSPSPLCYWCQFSPTNPTQPEEGKLLCPYYSLWTRENHTSEVAHKWKGPEQHEDIMALERAKQAAGGVCEEKFDFEF